MRPYSIFTAVAIVLVLLGECRGQTAWSGKCVGVSDGDTIRVMHLGKPQKIRLFGIDCPEKGQDFGERARQFTASLVFGKEVAVRPVTRDKYGRVVAWISVDNVSLNHELVKAGLAWWFRRYALKRVDLKRLEQEARKAGIGLWSHPNPIPPWEFRKEHRRAD